MDGGMMFVMVGLLLNGLLFAVLPGASRPGVLFSVGVEPTFVKEPVALRTLAKYRAIVFSVTTCAVVAFGWAPNSAVRWTAVFGQGVTILAAWAWAHRSVLPHAVPPESRRVAALVRRDTTLPGGPVAAIGPYLILGAAAAYLASNQQVIPPIFPTRWGFSGEPIRWAARSFVSVYGSLIMGACVVSLMIAQAAWVLRGTRQNAQEDPAMTVEADFKRRDVVYRMFSAYAAAILFAYFGMRKTAQSAGLGSEVFLLLLGIGVPAALMTAWTLSRGQGGTRGASESIGDGTPNAAWLGGLLYFNPTDPVVFVERRMGVGWTVNLGNPRTWVFGGCLLALFVFAVFFN